MFHRTDKGENGKIRYLVVGAGNIAQVAVLPAFANATENSELVGIVSDDPAKREALGQKYGIATGTYADLESLIEVTSADAVYVALPNSKHREFTERAARARVHVLCEKPMAMNSRDAQAMIAACDAAQVRLMIAYRLHFEETNLRAVELVRSGRIGEPRFFTASFSQQVRAGDIRTRNELGGGALFDMGIYCVNAARFLFRAEPTEVTAFQAHGTDERFRSVDEMTTGVLHFPGDRLAQFTASQGAADVDTLRIVGTEGDLRIEPAFAYTTGLKHFVTVGGKTQETAFEVRDQFAPELVHFSDCLLKGVNPEPSGEEGLADVRVLEALARAAETGKRVTLEPFDPGTRPDLSSEMKKPALLQKPAPVRAPSPSR